MMRWRVALLAGGLAGSVTLFFGFLAHNCTAATLLFRAFISLLLFASIGFLIGWALDYLFAGTKKEESMPVKPIGLSVDIKSEPEERMDEAAAENDFKPLSADDLGNMTEQKQE